MRLRHFVGLTLAFGLFCQTQEAKAQYSCRVKHLNSIDGGVITSLLTQFYYDDGTQSAYGPISVYIAKGEAGYTFSRDDTSCVKRASDVALIEYGGQSYPVAVDIPDAGDGYCWVTPEIEYSLSATVAMKAAKDAKNKTLFMERLKASTIDPRTGQRVPLKVRLLEDYDKHVADTKKNAAQK